MANQEGKIPLYTQIYNIVCQIPTGKVATYGQVARLVGGCTARMVGYALSALKDGREPEVPWQRVINAQGRISMHGIGSSIQRMLLEEEGIEFDQQDTVDLHKYLWEF